MISWGKLNVVTTSIIEMRIEQSIVAILYHPKQSSSTDYEDY